MKILLKYGWEKVSKWECLFVHREKGLLLSVYVDDIKSNGKKQNDPMWKILNKEVDLGEPTSFLDHVYFGCTHKQYEISKDIADNYRTMFESGISVGRTEKLPYSENFRISSWSYDMEGHAKKCVERYCELANKTTQQLYKVSTPWMCKKQTAVSHSSTESEIISLDAGLRLDGLPALEIWDLIVAVLGIGNTTQNHCRTVRLVVCRDKSHERQQSRGMISVLDNVDFIPTNVKSSHQEALLYVFEDSEAVIKMIIKGRNPTMRHVSRTHRVALDWLFDRISLDPKIQIKYIDTKTNSQTCYPREFSHVMKGIFFCVCLTSAISVLQSLLK